MSDKKPKNILFLVVDQLRFDMYDAATMPKSYAFFNHKRHFSNHLSGGAYTRIGIFTLFYGLYGTYYTQMSHNRFSPLFIDELLRQDYDMGIFGSASLSYGSFNRSVFSRISNLRLNSKAPTPHERDAEITEEWLLFMQSRDKQNDKRPFFGFLFYDAAHGYDFPDETQFDPPFKPYWKEVNHILLNNDFNGTIYKNRHKNAIYYIDGLLHRVYRDLRQRDLLKDTIVLLTGDHGEEFNENQKNYWGHGSNYSKEQTGVPLLMHWYKGDKLLVGETTYPTTHMDIVPTLMQEALNCTNPITDYADGKSLFDSHRLPYRILTNGIENGTNEFAIVEPDRITKMYNTGWYDIMDHRLNLLNDASLRLPTLKSVMEEIKRFYQWKRLNGFIIRLPSKL